MDEHVRKTIEIFFAAPSAVEPLGTVSTLHLVRREIQDCYVGRIVEPEEHLLAEPKRYRLFATAMVVFSGFDLLAKFATYGGSLGVSDAFVAFATRFCMSNGERLSEPEARTIWSFRNALVHSFGLYHEGPDGEIVHLFIYEQNASAPVVRPVDLRSHTDPEARPKAWELSLDDLVAMFLLGLRRYRAALDADDQLREAFMLAFERFGKLHRWGPRGVPVWRD